MSDEGVIAEANRRQASDSDEAIERLAACPLHRLSFPLVAYQQLAFSWSVNSADSPDVTRPAHTLSRSVTG
jgi:hypothetical protein